MKSPIRYLFIILTLGLFSSCAEQFREIRGSENRGNAFLAGELTSPTATKRTDKTKGEKVSPRQSIIPVEQATTDNEAQSTPTPNLIEPILEKVETNQTHVITEQKGRVSGKVKKDPIHSSNKKKLSKPAEILKKDKLQGDNGYKINWYLVTLGILGLMSSLIGLLFVLLLAYAGSGSIIMELLGYYYYPLRIDFFLFLLGFISSIWVIAKPTLKVEQPLKIIAILLTALSIFLILFLFIGIITY